MVGRAAFLPRHRLRRSGQIAAGVSTAFSRAFARVAGGHFSLALEKAGAALAVLVTAADPGDLVVGLSCVEPRQPSVCILSQRLFERRWPGRRGVSAASLSSYLFSRL